MPERASARLSARQHQSDPEGTSRDPSGQMGVAYFQSAQLRHYTRHLTVHTCIRVHGDLPVLQTS